MSNALRKIEKKNNIITMNFEEYKKNIAVIRSTAIIESSNIVFTEMVYELIKQMGYFECDDNEIRDQIKVRVKEIYDGCVKTIKSNVVIKKPSDRYLEKVKFLNNEFNIII